MQTNNNRSVVTIATGKPYYSQLAENLLKSFLLWNKDNGINFLLLCDDAAYFKQYQNLDGIHIKQINIPEDYQSFTAKFLLFEHAFANENLFIDCDCLVYKSLENAFDKFHGKNFSAIGNIITTGEFFCDVPTTMQKFGLKDIPKFVGSVYYFKKNSVSGEIFKAAADLKKKYNEFGFIRLRGKENEEPLFAVAMSQQKEGLLANDGTVKADMMYYKKITANILKGKAALTKPIFDITGGETIPETSCPAIVHFNGSFADGYHYKVECVRLSHTKINKYLLEAGILLSHTVPEQFIRTTKNVLRPAFGFLIGHRKIKETSR
jgi:hypothetical protein